MLEHGLPLCLVLLEARPRLWWIRQRAFGYLILGNDWLVFFHRLIGFSVWFFGFRSFPRRACRRWSRYSPLRALRRFITERYGRRLLPPRLHEPIYTSGAVEPALRAILPGRAEWSKPRLLYSRAHRQPICFRVVCKHRRRFIREKLRTPSKEERRLCSNLR